MKIYRGYSPNDNAVIQEMSSDGITAPNGIEVPVDQSVIDQIKADDENPLFVTIEVINDGISRNGNHWTKQAIAGLVEQINAKRPDGYMGHLKPDERRSKFPDPVVVWLGATAKEVDGKTRLFAKGYVLPEAKTLRSWLKTAVAAKKNVAVSVYGAATRVVRGIADMTSFNLESIDLARPGSEGVRNMGLLTVTQEMADDSGNAEQGDDMTLEEALKSATVSDLRAYVPESVIQEMVEEAGVNEAEPQVIQEMTDVRDALGIDDKSDKKPAEVIQEMREKTRDLELDGQLRDKVDVAAARPVIKTLVVAEMVDDEALDVTVDRVLGSERGQAVIAEMVAAAPPVAPQVDKPSASARKYTTKKS